MIDKNKILNIPLDELNFIHPDHRPKFFMDLINNYKERYPTLKLKYAYLNTDPKQPIDYIVLFQTKNLDNTLDLMVFDSPMLYSDRSLPGYRFCKRTGIEDDFFKEAINSMVSISLIRFNEFINTMLNLSINPSDERYWRKPEFAESVSKGLLDLSLRYNKRN